MLYGVSVSPLSLLYKYIYIYMPSSIYFFISLCLYPSLVFLCFPTSTMYPQQHDHDYYYSTHHHASYAAAAAPPIFLFPSTVSTQQEGTRGVVGGGGIMSTPNLNSSFHDHNQPQQPIPKKGSTKSSGGGRRRKPNNGHKQPGRGMGVQQLELHLRMQEAAAATATRQNKLSLQGHFNKQQSSSSNLRNINVLYPVEYSNGGVSDYAADLMLRQQRKQQRLYFEEWVKRYRAEDGSGQIFPMANVEHEGKAVGLEEEELSSVPKMTLINGQLYDYQSTNCQLPCCTHLEKKRSEYGGGMAALMGLKYSNEIRAAAGEDEATAKVLPLVNRSSYNYYPLGLLGSSHGSTSTTTQLQQLGTVDMVGTSERQKEYYEFIPTHKTSTFPEEEDDHDHDHDQVLMEGSAAASCLTTSDHHHDDQLQFQQQYYSSSGYNYRVASNYYPNYNSNSLDLSLKL